MKMEAKTMSNYRRFGNRPYRLIARLPHFDEMGRERTSNMTMNAANRKAELLRKRGYNARVVNWVGGSGIYMTNKKYNRTLSQAREKWLDEIDKSDMLAGAMGGFSINSQAGDDPITASIMRKIVGFKNQESSGPQEAFVKYPLAIQRLNWTDEELIEWQKDTNPNDITALNMEMALLGDKELVKDIVHVNNPFKGIFMHTSFGEQHKASNVDKGGLLGWGPGKVIPSKGNVPSSVDPTRTRYRVTMIFPRVDEDTPIDGYGEAPTFAFSSLESANTFAKRLREQIDDIGYYSSGGRARIAEGVSMASIPYAIDKKHITIDVVEEKSSGVQRMQDAQQFFYEEKDNRSKEFEMKYGEAVDEQMSYGDNGGF